MNGEGFAYFRWHTLQYWNCPPFSHRRDWRFDYWARLQSRYAVNKP